MRVLIISLILIVGFYEGQRQTLTKEIKSLTNKERIEYNNKIKEWIPPIIIPKVKKPVTGWKNRLNR